MIKLFSVRNTNLRKVTLKHFLNTGRVRKRYASLKYFQNYRMQRLRPDQLAVVRLEGRSTMTQKHYQEST